MLAARQDMRAQYYEAAIRLERTAAEYDTTTAERLQRLAEAFRRRAGLRLVVG